MSADQTGSVALRMWVKEIAPAPKEMTPATCVAARKNAWELSARGPKQGDVGESKKKLHSCRRPGYWQGIEHALVTNVVANVQNVPDGKEPRQPECAFQASVNFIRRHGAKLAALWVKRVAAAIHWHAVGYLLQ
eukprot:scaffold85281_cov58-Attheya_sp.AAC.2